MGGDRGLMEFKPARRVFAGRGRSLLTFSEWRIAICGIAFGALIGAGWFAGDWLPDASPIAVMEQPRPPVALLAPPEVAREATAPVNASAADRVESEDAASAPAASLAVNEAPPRIDYAGAIARIVDGDTFYLEGLSTRIRLWGVDAPERDEAGYDEATAALAGLVFGRTLSCEHIDVDPYRRIVARCYFEDGSDLSRAMIESGAVDEYMRFTARFYSGE